MIKHHPSSKLLAGYAAGELPASIAIGVSIHSHMCPQCSGEIEKITNQISEQLFNAEITSKTVYEDEQFDTSLFNIRDNHANNEAAMDMEFGNMIAAITADDEISEQSMVRNTSISVRGKCFELPNALNNVRMSNWLNIGKLSRSSLNLDEGAIHSHLLHIDADGEVPTHTHKGFEITLLLDGSFEDEMGTYHPGDFIELNGEHNHQPRTKEGCLCYTVADDALQFTEGFHKLFNPIGSLLY